MPLRVKVLADVASVNPNWARQNMPAIEAEIRNGIRAWVEYLQKRLPTYTDTLRGTLVPAARIARAVVATRGNRAPWKKEFVYRGQTWPLGFDKGANYARANLTKNIVNGNSMLFTFTYDNDIPYFIWNNLKPAPPWLHLPSNPPWHALEAAAIVFKTYIDGVMPQRLRATMGSLTVKVTQLKAY